ncbi:hypothetical protein F5878DRAFT_638940 [Lentinula raphanica]|uniref:Uncharacterized protein n=1 Tax=Lentinula raphanica TaxID=153919 RepID=A0AA38PGU8_9AGAR|nr:hypothetical protein F5878DRAFT_638940 [Lentinula raphanica]
MATLCPSSVVAFLNLCLTTLPTSLGSSSPAPIIVPARFEAFNRIQTRTKGFAQFEYLANPANRLQRPATLDLFEVTYGSGAVLGLETDETVNVSPDVAVVNQSIGGEIDSMGFDGVDGILRNFQFLVLWPYI